MSRPELTIAIPTYNRLNRLSKALPYIEQAFDNYNVEIIVSDNASTDKTEQYMKNYVTSSNKVFYYRNSSNLGYSGNFANCFNKAKGKYVWLLSDDDILIKESVCSIFECIDLEPVLIFLNTSTIIDENKVEYRPRLDQTKGIQKYLNKEEYYRTIGIYSTFISAVIFNTDIVRHINKKKYSDDSLITGYVLESLKNNGEYVINYRNCVAARTNEKVGYDVYKVWVYQYPHDLLTIGPECGFTKSYLKKQTKYDLNNMIYNFVLKFRLTCDYSTWDQNYVWKYAGLSKDLSFWYYLAVKLPICFLPLLRKIHAVYRRIFN